MNYNLYEEFWTGLNTLEGNQSFNSIAAIQEFVKNARAGNFRVPYSCVFIVDINDDCLAKNSVRQQDLDGFEAITIAENDLSDFNNCHYLVTSDQQLCFKKLPQTAMVVRGSLTKNPLQERVLKSGKVRSG